MDLLNAVSYHQLVLASEGRTIKTQRQYLHFEKVFLRYLESAGIKPEMDALNPANVRAALTWYQSLSDGRRTRGGEVGGMVLVDILHLFARFLEREGLYDEDPLRKIRRVKIAKRLRQPFSQTEVMALWGACKQSQMPLRDEALLLLLLDHAGHAEARRAAHHRRRARQGSSTARRPRRRQRPARWWPDPAGTPALPALAP